MGFLYEIKEEIKGERGKYIEITGYEGTLCYLELPAELSGLPVRSVGNRAFEGRRDLEEIRIPDSIRELRPFAFYNCHHLKKITLTDSVLEYHDGVIRLCEELRDIAIHFQTGGNYRLLKEMLGDNDGSLRFHLFLPEGEEAEFYFPYFSDDFEEDTYARTLHERIEGSGYEYRQTVKRGEIEIQRYDRIFERGRREELTLAAGIALSRLRYPYQLSEAAEGEYRAYILEKNAELLPYLLRGEERELIYFLRDAELLTETGIRAALPVCAEKQYTELTAVLMNYQRQHFAARVQVEEFIL